MANAKGQKGGKSAAERAIRIVPDDDGIKMPRVYANFALITHGEHDFMIYFCDVQDITPDNEHVRLDGDVYRAPVVAKVARSPSFVRKLVDTLKAN